ncbi:unnamed protein product, partial [Discosporangium mesarthrocarpum]
RKLSPESGPQVPHMAEGDGPPGFPRHGWVRPKKPTFIPRSDFSVKVESGLRTALAVSLSFIWRTHGPFNGNLAFFAGVVAIVSVGKTAGETIDRNLQLTCGAILGILSAFLVRWLGSCGRVLGVIAFFFGILVVVSNPWVSPLGKKFGSLAVVILTLTPGAAATNAFPLEWLLSALTWVRTHVEGGVFALVSLLLPYPRFALREGSLRAQVTAR